MNLIVSVPAKMPPETDCAKEGLSKSGDNADRGDGDESDVHMEITFTRNRERMPRTPRRPRKGRRSRLQTSYGRLPLWKN